MAKNAPVDNGDSFCRAPIGIVDWTARARDKEVIVQAHTWFEAREKAAIHFNEPNIQSIEVTQKVIENKETCSGITIHLVNKEYDKGTILFQAVCKIIEDDTADTLAQKIHSLEYQYFPQIILTKINTTK